MRRERLSGALLFVLLMLCVSVASAPAAATIKPHKLVVPINAWVLPAVDGTDVYWVKDKKVRQGKIFRYETLLSRSSLVNRSRVRLARFGADGFGVARVLAGGGQVVINLEAGGVNTPLDSRVVRIGRDGSNRQVLASGSKPGWNQESVVEGGRARPNDCGTHVQAESVTAIGSVVLMQTRGERESSRCGGRPNVDHVLASEVALTGVSREIYTDEIPIEPSQTAEVGTGTGPAQIAPDGRYVNPWKPKVRVQGDRAVYVKRGGGPAFVRDLNTGALAGPFGTGLKGPGATNFATLDPSGRVAMAALSLRSKKTKHVAMPQPIWFAYRTGVFDTPMSPTPFTRVRKLKSIQFCGSRMIGATSNAYVELEPETFRIRRRVAHFPSANRAFGLSDECTSEWAYVFSPWAGDLTVLGYPLG